MKKLIALILCLTLALALAACSQGDAGKDPTDEPTEKPTEAPTEEPTEAPTEAPTEEPTEEPTDEPTDEPTEGDTPTPPPFGGFGGIGGIGGGSEAPDVPVTDAGDLVDQLKAICDKVLGDRPNITETLRRSGEYYNMFGGKVEYEEGMRVAENHLEMMPPAHTIMLIEPLEGVDVNEYAKLLEDNADLRWEGCTSAETLRVEVKDGLILFVMSSAEIADAAAAAFLGSDQ